MQQQEYILFPTGGKNNERQKYHRRTYTFYSGSIKVVNLTCRKKVVKLMQQQEYILFPTGGKNNERQKYHRRKKRYGRN